MNGTGHHHQSRVFIVSDVRLYRDGMSVMLARARTLKIVGAMGQHETVTALHLVQPYVVLMDGSLPRLVDLISTVNAAAPASKIVAFALADLDAQAIPCAEAGIMAFVGCDATANDLVTAVEQARRGEIAAWMRDA